MEEYTKKCPFCGGEINNSAIKCKHCKRFIDDYHKETVINDNKSKGCLKIFIYTICAFICLISLLAMIPTSDDPQTIAENNKKEEQLKRERELKRIEKEAQEKREEAERQRLQEEKDNQRIQREYERQQREEQAKRAKLEVLETYICYEGYWKAVCGTVRNNKDRSVYMASIDISLFDREGNVVSNISDYIDELRPGQVWKFKALIDTNDASTFKVNGVDGW
jgi:flagellar biosynthesis GTPase FlhF